MIGRHILSVQGPLWQWEQSSWWLLGSEVPESLLPLTLILHLLFLQVSLLVNTRQLLAMARYRLLPWWLAKIDPRTSTPWRLTLIFGAIKCFLALTTSAPQLAKYRSGGVLFVLAVVASALLWRRYVKDDELYSHYWVGPGVRLFLIVLISMSKVNFESWELCFPLLQFSSGFCFSFWWTLQRRLSPLLGLDSSHLILGACHSELLSPSRGSLLSLLNLFLNTLDSLVSFLSSNLTFNLGPTWPQLQGAIGSTCQLECYIWGMFLPLAVGLWNSYSLLPVYGC